MTLDENREDHLKVRKQSFSPRNFIKIGEPKNAIQQQIESRRIELGQLDRKLLVRIDQVEKIERRLLKLQQETDYLIPEPLEGFEFSQVSGQIKEENTGMIEDLHNLPLRVDPSSPSKKNYLNSDKASEKLDKLPKSESKIPTNKKTIIPSSNKTTFRSLRNTLNKTVNQNSPTRFTMFKSLFSANQVNLKPKFSVDSSKILIGKRIPSFCTDNYEIHQASVDNWICIVKLIKIQDNELKFLKRLQSLEELPAHHNIVRYWFHEMDIEKGEFEIFTEYFDSTLEEFIKQRTEAFTPLEIQFILLEVVKGLEVLHSYSILHYNLSPFNIHLLFDKAGNIYRIAIANIEMRNERTSISKQDVFSAPEVNSNNKTEHSFVSDIWSLGLISYCLLTIRTSWNDEKLSNEDNYLKSVKLDESEFEKEYKPFIEIFSECTHISPEDRPPISVVKQALLTKMSISDQKRISEMNIGYTFQPKREYSKFFEHFLVIGSPIGCRKPEKNSPKILFQYPPTSVSTLSNPEMIVNLSMINFYPPQKIKRTKSMSKINEKIFASRDVIEKSSNCSIFTMMEGEELRYGICVYFDEPVNIVPSFIPMEKALIDSKKNPETNPKNISRQPDSFSLQPDLKKNTSFYLKISDNSENPNVKIKRKTHQRNVSDGHFLNQKKQDSKSPDMGYVKFISRCYMFYSKWPFFKLHFEVLWAILAQERLTRIKLFDQKEEVDKLSSLQSKNSLPKNMESLPENMESKNFVSENMESSFMPEISEPNFSLENLNSKNPEASSSSTKKTKKISKKKLKVHRKNVISSDLNESKPKVLNKSLSFKVEDDYKSQISDSHSETVETIDYEENCNFMKMIISYHTSIVPTTKLECSLDLPNLPEPLTYILGHVIESVAEWCFPCLFRVLSTKTLLKLFQVAMLEEKIVLISPNSGILTSCVTGITAMLRPYAWQGTFLTNVPQNMMAVLESPVPYLVGLEKRPSDFSNDQIVVVDLSKDTITCPHTLPKLPNYDKLYDSFNIYSNNIRNNSNHAKSSHNLCKTTAHDIPSLLKILLDLADWHTSFINPIASVPNVDVDFDWNNESDVENLIKSLPSDREFYARFFETQHFSMYSSRLGPILSQIRNRHKIDDLF